MGAWARERIGRGCEAGRGVRGAGRGAGGAWSRGDGPLKCGP